MTEMRGAAHPFRLALRFPYVTNGVSVRFRAGFLVSLGADGHTGWGEASPLPGWSRTTLLHTETALRRTLEGLDAGGEAALDALIASLDDSPHARARNDGRLGRPPGPAGRPDSGRPPRRVDGPW